MNQTKGFRLLILAGLIVGSAVLAHHSRNQYDMSAKVEMSGEIVDVRWRNPHVMYTLKVDGPDGSQNWMLEAGSLYMLARTGVTENKVKVGDQVRVAGYPSGRGDPEFYLTNVLLPDGQEVVMLPSSNSYWSEEALGGREQWSSAAVSESNAAQGIFRVWSPEKVSGRTTFPGISELPLTPNAQFLRDNFDPLTDDPNLNCDKPGMPRAMRGPHPVQFIDHGDTIEVRIAEYDIRRTIHLIGKDNPENPEPEYSKQGYSRGGWSGNTLDVLTDHVQWPFFDGEGTPQSRSVEMREKFTLSEDGKRLDYEVVVTDPQTFTKPVTMRLYWVDLGEPMEIYNCIPSY